MRQPNLTKRERRKRRVRAKLRQSASPRLSVFRSHKHISAQIIDDSRGVTVVSVGEYDIKKEKEKTKPGSRRSQAPPAGEEPQATKLDRAARLGEILATRARAQGIKRVAFDRGPYRFHGRVKALADAARKAGLTF